ncbi:MAG: flagellar basal body rod protein FlgB [Candidatus Eisenbacteria bacterium]|uniref:Flagellar basal body rod protein FlgB n=1 Tax=Eiseniibacteriota bacterium TaxID=2212470 RepID=A0A948RYY4_UNCEI|nr:flagellar basal body rod protein FlgB [Candidatus Eisenbacteria bacterium]MBU1950939.1 flagellar basal body rod protein FlgB [Candidatus Eisenbacteria bacterium]MBU2692188.1 flagellar basal body rod protein FlgB [Candidatus Eisenbacteria bacterium]
MDGITANQGSIPILRKALDAAALRQKVAASNLANIQTPGYKPQAVKFEELLSGMQTTPSLPLNSSKKGHIAGETGGSRASKIPGPRVVADSEPLELERQIIELQKSTLHYQALSQFVAGHYRSLIDAIGPIR